MNRRLPGKFPLCRKDLSGGQARPSLLGAAKHVVARLDHLEAACGLLVAGRGVGMVGLGEPAIGRLDLLETGVRLQLEQVQCAHLVAAAAAVAGAAPAIMAGAGEGGGAFLLARLARCRLLRGQSLEIIPVAVVFGGMALAEIPALAAVRGFGRGPVAGIFAAMAVALAHGLRLARGAVSPPAREPPVVRSL